MYLIKEKVVKPCLRWAGGKSWLIKHLCKLVSSLEYNNYHEPFLGGGAVFLSINIPGKAFLSDLNAELIETYVALRDNPLEILDILSTYKNSERFYYQLRGKHFQSSVERAAKFIYLNQTSYNGIYRVNKFGQYNVPYGYRKKTFLDEQALLRVSESLKKASIECSDFDIVRQTVKAKDLVFLDPPYTVSHNSNGFIKYNQKIFSLEDQYRLNELIKFIKQTGAYYILTNAAHSTIKEIFDNGDSCIELNRASLVGGKKAKRGMTSELFFTNIKLMSYDKSNE